VPDEGLEVGGVRLEAVIHRWGPLAVAVTAQVGRDAVVSVRSPRHTRSQVCAFNPSPWRKTIGRFPFVPQSSQVDPHPVEYRLFVLQRNELRHLDADALPARRRVERNVSELRKVAVIDHTAFPRSWHRAPLQRAITGLSYGGAQIRRRRTGIDRAAGCEQQARAVRFT